MANWPTSVVGKWRGFANQSAIELVIANQGTIGVCKAITGTLMNIPPSGQSKIQGFYCPDTGRMSFVRKDIHTNDTFQSYSASASDVGPELRVSGTFAELNMAGHLGEYNFAVEKKES